MASSITTTPHRNRLLGALSRDDFALLEPSLKSVQLALRQSLEEPNQLVKTVYFIEQGVVSVVTASVKDVKGEVGLIGCEGITGLSLLLADGRSPHSVYMQVEGRRAAHRCQRSSKCASQIGYTASRLLRYVQSFLVQVAHTAVANANALVEQRLARWLLMVHDRVDGDDLRLSHEFIGLMVGTRRAGVTEAIHALVQRGVIRNRRKSITVIDREGLEAVAAKFYGVPEAEYERLID